VPQLAATTRSRLQAALRTVRPRSHLRKRPRSASASALQKLTDQPRLDPQIGLQAEPPSIAVHSRRSKRSKCKPISQLTTHHARCMPEMRKRA
jgi:hypothetical protein